MKIVVIGGTGRIGSKAVAILRQGGHEVIAASPNSGVSTITGEGLEEVRLATGWWSTSPIRPRSKTRR